MRAAAGIGEDARFARNAWIRALSLTASIERQPRVTLPVLPARWAERDADAVALASREAVWSYRDLASACNRHARWGLDRGLRPGDVVALMMENCVEYPAIWLGLARIGVAVALVNTNLRDEALAHAIGVVAPKLIVCGAGCAAELAAVRGRMPDGLGLFVHGAEMPGFASMESGLAAAGDDPVDPSECEPPSIDDVALYIYTSGTTGLPKAARVSHYRVMQWSHWFAGMMDTGAADRMYVCLPMYHSVGGVVAPGAALVGGGSVVIRPQFSAGEFWHDIETERCTLFQYIGELCRYLLNGPIRAEETRHALRMACGNGLRPEVWEPFKRRFRIPRILEYYAATEGNFSLYNCEGEPGSIGRIPPFLSRRLPVALLRFDVDAERPLRNAAGFCERAAPDEIGEAVGAVST
ncbi:MAG: AMP-binding protein, partial [Gammaproteobacteria bacterium]|nr:AMP-binding protein [Gammaproteobacteria bacterium]